MTIHELDVYNKMVDFFIKEVTQHQCPKSAIDRLNYMIFYEHKDEFWSMTEEEQWYVRNCLESLKKVHY